MSQKPRISNVNCKLKVVEKLKLVTVCDNEKFLQKLNYIKASINNRNEQKNTEMLLSDRKEKIHSSNLLKRFIICGVNTVQKSIEKRKTAIVFISGEKMPVLPCASNSELLASIYPLHAHIIEACKLHHIPVVILPKSNEYKEYFKVKKLSCLAIPNVDGINGIINCLKCYNKDEIDTIHASFDGLKEFIN